MSLCLSRFFSLITSLSLSLSLSLYLSIYLSLFFHIPLYVPLCLYLPTYLSVCVYLSVCLSLSLSLSVSLSLSLSLTHTHFNHLCIPLCAFFFNFIYLMDLKGFWSVFLANTTDATSQKPLSNRSADKYLNNSVCIERAVLVCIYPKPLRIHGFMLFQKAFVQKEKSNQPYLGSEVGSPILFPTLITVTLVALYWLYLRGSLNKFLDFFRMGSFINSTHMKL